MGLPALDMTDYDCSTLQWRELVIGGCSTGWLVPRFHFREVLKQPVLARFGKLRLAVSTPPHHAEFDCLNFRLAHVGGNAGGDVVVRRMDQRIGHKEVMPLAEGAVKKSPIRQVMVKSIHFREKYGAGLRRG